MRKSFILIDWHQERSVGSDRAILRAVAKVTVNQNSRDLQSRKKRKGDSMSKAKTKPIKAIFGFTKATPDNLDARANAVLAGVYADPAYVKLTPPIDKATFQAAANSYSTLKTAALDGGKKAIAARNHQGQILGKMLRQLALWVEANCNENMNTFLASGFLAATASPGKTQPVTESIRKIEPGKAGEFLLTPTTVPGAGSYEVRYTQAVVGGTPTNWATQLARGTRPPMSITGLTPGVSYVFQIRAVTKAGTTDWSDPITRICT
jgi:Fibronectin type III domain